MQSRHTIGGAEPLFTRRERDKALTKWLFARKDLYIVCHSPLSKLLQWGTDYRFQD